MRSDSNQVVSVIILNKIYYIKYFTRQVTRSYTCIYISLSNMYKFIFLLMFFVLFIKKNKISVAAFCCTIIHNYLIVYLFILYIIECIYYRMYMKKYYYF